MKRPESIYLTVSTRFRESSKRAPSAAFVVTMACIPFLVACGVIGLAITGDLRVYNSKGEVVLYDNTGAYQPILKSALIRVTALRHMEIAGHKLPRYRT